MGPHLAGSQTKWGPFNGIEDGNLFGTAKMITIAAISAVLNTTILALTPMERWDSMKKLGDGSIIEHRLILAGLALIIVLVFWLIVVSYNRAVRQRIAAEKAFLENAQRRGLSARESTILQNIAGYAGIRHIERIFTMPDAFNEGAAKIIEQSQAQGLSAEQVIHLKTQLLHLREKLGYKRWSGPSVERATKSKHKPGGGQTAANEIVEAAEIEELNRLTHDKEAFVAEFPLVRVFIAGDRVREKGQNEGAASNGALTARCEDVWVPPVFVGGVVTEIFDSVLRIEAPLQVEEGDRVLVVFKLNGERKSAASAQNGKIQRRIIEDIGRVISVQAHEKGFSIEIELSGLNGPDVDELLEQINVEAASIKRS